jgi:hypothetical protein
MSTPPMAKSLASIWTSNGLMKSNNPNRGADENLFFKSTNALYCSSFHLKDKFFLRRSKSGFTNCKKPFINF